MARSMGRFAFTQSKLAACAAVKLVTQHSSSAFQKFPRIGFKMQFYAKMKTPPDKLVRRFLNQQFLLVATTVSVVTRFILVAFFFIGMPQQGTTTCTNGTANQRALTPTC